MSFSWQRNREEQEMPPTYQQTVTDLQQSYDKSPLNNAPRDSYLLAANFRQFFPPVLRPTTIQRHEWQRLMQHGISTLQFQHPPKYSGQSRLKAFGPQFDQGQGPGNILLKGPTTFTFTQNVDSCLQTDLPLPSSAMDNFEVDTFQVTIMNKTSETVVAVGLASKPYPPFRLPGWDPESIGYHSDDGRKYHNDPNGGKDYGPTYTQGDVITVQYTRTSGSVQFFKNGQRLGPAVYQLTCPLYPTVGTDGPCQISVRWLPSQQATYANVTLPQSHEESLAAASAHQQALPQDPSSMQEPPPPYQ
ncbi:Protein ssh4 [Dispira simplex]|nr:Protein ssh4 [Dispira simplex]